MGISDRAGRRAGSGPRAGLAGIDRGTLVGVGVAVTVAGALAAVALTAGGSALAAGRPGPGTRPVVPAPVTTAMAAGYQFVQLGSHRDRTYNALNGINNHGRIAGVYGSGEMHHPSKGYTMVAPYSQGAISYENFPKSVQTEVEGLNDNGVQVGFYSTQNKVDLHFDNSFGWYYNGSFHKVVYPTGNNSNPPQDELNGVNNHNVAVGSYMNSSGRYRGYTYTIKTGKFALVTKPGAPTGGNAPSLAAFGINNAGDVVGEYTPNPSSDTIDGFIKFANGVFHTIAVPGATETFALGVNDSDTVVGAYIDRHHPRVHLAARRPPHHDGR